MSFERSRQPEFPAMRSFLFGRPNNILTLPSITSVDDAEITAHYVSNAPNRPGRGSRAPSRPAQGLWGSWADQRAERYLLSGTFRSSIKPPVRHFEGSSSN